jgi:hypothetical protein
VDLWHAIFFSKVQDQKQSWHWQCLSNLLWRQ